MNSWGGQLNAALRSAKAGGLAVRAQFARREVRAYKGHNDVQLRADISAQEIIVRELRAAYPDYGVVAEEDAGSAWPDGNLVWVVDPLDGSNNFGFGIAHCAISITLFHDDAVVLAVVFDPLLHRVFAATDSQPPVRADVPAVPIHRAMVSLVTNYSEPARCWLARATDVLGAKCRRAVNLWAPALDLALVASGAIDAMICHEGYLGDTCGGLFLVSRAGGHVVDFKGQPLATRGSMINQPVSFVATRNQALLDELLDLVMLEL